MDIPLIEFIRIVEVVKGQANEMEPASDLTEEQLKQIIDFLKDHK